MTAYATGTLAVTNASDQVVGTSTAFVGNVYAGMFLRMNASNALVEVESVEDNTHLTLVLPWAGSTGSGLAYAVLPTEGATKTHNELIQTLIDGTQAVFDGYGSGIGTVGSTSAPTFRVSGDLDTGVNLEGGNVGALVAAGSNMLKWNANGVGIGGSPTAFGAGYTSLNIVSSAIPVLDLTVGSTRTFSILTQAASSKIGTVTNTPLNLMTNDTVRVTVNEDGVSVGGTPVDYGAGYNTLNIEASTIPLFDLSVATVRTGTFYALSSEVRIGSVTNIPFVIYQNNVAVVRVAASGHVTPEGDNTQNLGSGSKRWGTVYAGTGTINTSDARDKEWRGGLTDKELRVARLIASKVGVYQMKEAITAKGADRARLHIGVTAQDVKSAFESEGLDGFSYGILCFDQWDEEWSEDVLVQTAGDRYGVRYEELIMFIIGAMFGAWLGG